MKFNFTENIDNPDAFGRLVDMNGQLVNRDGTPVEQWVIDLHRRMVESGPIKSAQERPNVERLREFLRFVSEIKKVTNVSDDDIIAEVDRRIGRIDLEIRSTKINISADGAKIRELFELADNVAAGAYTDGTVSLTATFCGFFTKEDK